MAEYLIQSETLDDIADAIHAKNPSATYPMTPAQMATAIGSISGGGGVTTFTGTIELTNEDVSSLLIPVDVHEYSNIRVRLNAVETGLVENGEVVKYQELSIPSVFTTKDFCSDYYVDTPSVTNRIIYNGTNYSTLIFGNVRYRARMYGSNPAFYSIAADDIFGQNGISTPLQNANRRFCVEGAYVKFSYKVEAW